MKKILALLLAILMMVGSLASCDWFTEEKKHEHTWEYVQYETGHFKQYTCGCPSPDIMGEHCDNDGDLRCDYCKYLLDLSGAAQIVLDYEQELRDDLDKLRAEHPEYNYYFHPVDTVCCSFTLSDNTSASDIAEKYDMNNLFAGANIYVYNSIETISVIFDRNDFTEEMHQRIKQISEEEPLVESLQVMMERAYSQSYMPKIEYYTDYEAILKYEPAPYAVGVENSKDIIIRTKEEYDAYLDELLESWMSSDSLIAYYQIEIIGAARDKYDDAFFEENALILTRMITRGSGSIKLTVNNLYIAENKVYIVIRTDVPMMGTADMQYAFFAFAVDKDDVVNVNEVITLE